MVKINVHYKLEDGRVLDWDASMQRLKELADDAVSKAGLDPDQAFINVRVTVNDYAGNHTQRGMSDNANTVALQAWHDEQWVVEKSNSTPEDEESV